MELIVFGAASSIAQATLRSLAEQPLTCVLIDRNTEHLAAVARDLTVRGSTVHTITADLADTARHQELITKALEHLPHLDTALIAYGTLGDQAAGATDFTVAQQEFNTNFISVASLLTQLANHFEKKQRGTIAAISSVAGDRGRQSNYIYGTAKGALSIFLQGLRNRLAPHNIRIITFKPGFVKTPMTEHIKKNFLWAEPDTVGRIIAQHLRRPRRDVVYVPWFWRYIMLIIKLIPEARFKHLKL